MLSRIEHRAESAHAEPFHGPKFALRDGAVHLVDVRQRLVNDVRIHLLMAVEGIAVKRIRLTVWKHPDHRHELAGIRSGIERWCVQVGALLRIAANAVQTDDQRISMRRIRGITRRRIDLETEISVIRRAENANGIYGRACAARFNSTTATTVAAKKRIRRFAPRVKFVLHRLRIRRSSSIILAGARVSS